HIELFVEHLSQITIRHNLPPVHNHNPLRIPRNKIQPMLHHNNRQPQFSPQVVRSTHNLLSSMRIEKRRWLIKNDNARLHSQNPGQGHSLLLATRELVRSQFLQRGSARDLHRHINPLPNLVPAESEILRTERDVLLDRQSESLILRVLEDVADAAE